MGFTDPAFVRDHIRTLPVEPAGLYRCCGLNTGEPSRPRNRPDILVRQYQPVAALALRLVKRNVCPVQHFGCCFPTIGRNRDPQADCHDCQPVRAARVGYGLVGHSQPQPFTDGESCGDGAIVEQDHKFLAAIARDETSVVVVLA